jgi:hypothetical protein
VAGRKPKDKSGKPRQGHTIRLSERDEFYIQALIEQYYGDNHTEILRAGLKLLVKQAQRAGDVPEAPKRLAKDIPPAADDD